MSTIIDDMQRLAAERTATARKEYNAILRRDIADRSAPQDAARLAEAMETLGLSAADVAEHLAALRTHANLQKQVRTPGEIEAAQAEIEAHNEAVRAEANKMLIDLLAKSFSEATEGALLQLQRLPGVAGNVAPIRIKMGDLRDVNEPRGRSILAQAELDRLVRSHPLIFHD